MNEEDEYMKKLDEEYHVLYAQYKQLKDQIWPIQKRMEEIMDEEGRIYQAREQARRDKLNEWLEKNS